MATDRGLFCFDGQLRPFRRDRIYFTIFVERFYPFLSEYRPSHPQHDELWKLIITIIFIDKRSYLNPLQYSLTGLNPDYIIILWRFESRCKRCHEISGCNVRGQYMAIYYFYELKRKSSAPKCNPHTLRTNSVELYQSDIRRTVLGPVERHTYGLRINQSCKRYF